MITPLTILSLDQGKFYRPEPVPSDDVDPDAIAARHFSRTGAASGQAWLFASVATLRTLVDKSRRVFKAFRPERPDIVASNAVAGEP